MKNFTFFKIAAIVMLLFGVNQFSFSQSTGEIDGHEWVDLGLSVKWATCNLGAEEPAKYGNFFAWGETKKKRDYTRETSVTLDKEMEDIAGNPEYDAATASWGNPWRLPTKEEVDELFSKCKTKIIPNGALKALEVTGPNGNKIILPASGGYMSEGKYVGRYFFGLYWTSTPEPDDTGRAFYMSVGKYAIGKSGSAYRDNGLLVRPVTE